MLEKEPGCRQEFAVAVTAILGEKKFAYMLFLSAFASCYIGCPSCEFWDEDMEFGDSVVSERIQEAESPTELWDGESLEDAKLWLFNLFITALSSSILERHQLTTSPSESARFLLMRSMPISVVWILSKVMAETWLRM